MDPEKKQSQILSVGWFQSLRRKELDEGESKSPLEQGACPLAD